MGLMDKLKGKMNKDKSGGETSAPPSNAQLSGIMSKLIQCQ